MSFVHFKRVIILVAAILVLVTVVGSAPSMNFTAEATSSTTKMKNKISNLEAKSRQLASEISKLKKDASKQADLKAKLAQQAQNTENQIDTINAQLRALTADINKASADIKAKQADVSAARDLFNKRIRAMYISGGNTDLQVILSASDFADFLAKTELMRTVSKMDSSLLEKLRNDINVINARKSEVTDKAGDVADIGNTLKAKQRQLDSQYKEVKNNLAQINEDKQAAEEEKADVVKAKQKLERELEAAIRNSVGTVVFKGGNFTWPVPSCYGISSKFGPRHGRYHTGVDISQTGIYGARIVAAASGKVLIAGNNGSGYGNYVAINHGTLNGNTYTTLYGHCSSVIVSVGQSVTKGQTIAYVGSSGNSTGPHLHFEIRVNGSARNPMSFFSK